MLPQKRLLLVDELKPGMVLSIDINVEGKVLLAKGVAITEAIINRLKENYKINKVEVYLGNDLSTPLLVKAKTVKEMEDTFNEFSQSLEDIFDNMSNVQATKMNEIRDFSQRIREEFNATGTVIKNVVFYGSGNDPIYRHSVNVAAISFILGKWIGLDDKEISLLTYAAILHDIGKTKLNKVILSKNCNLLMKKEEEIYMTHPIIGYNYVKQIPYLNPSVGHAVLMHHERLDGSGYPLKAKEDKIPVFAKIIAIADIFDEVCSNRYSKAVRGPLDALKIIKDESLTKLDGIYSNIFLNHVVNYYMGENVKLNDERICKIIQIQINDLTRPLLLDDSGFLDLKNEKDLYVKKLAI